MNLFGTADDHKKNILPFDGEVYYHGPIFSATEANLYLEKLLQNIAWKNDEAFLLGKHIITKRKAAWYGDAAFEYTYSNITKKALGWTEELLLLKKKLEEKTAETFNSCLLNLYHSGAEGMAWHSDGEKDLKPNGAIGSLSFGAERKFSFKHKKTGQKVSIQLEHGSLLVMTGTTQTHWLHRLPPSTKINNARINLTFRTIIQ
ncbi:MAG: alpha-ketoglutarate-dependent dioxygenase AlkB [Ferruginibacter sp.]